jgi:hypothetical protein
VGIRTQKQLYISLVRLSEATHSITAEQANTFVEMIHRCHTPKELDEVKAAWRSVSRPDPADHAARRLMDDDLFEEEDPPALREALERSRVNLKSS